MKGIALSTAEPLHAQSGPPSPAGPMQEERGLFTVQRVALCTPTKEGNPPQFSFPGFLYLLYAVSCILKGQSLLKILKSPTLFPFSLHSLCKSLPSPVVPIMPATPYAWVTLAITASNGTNHAPKREGEKMIFKNRVWSRGDNMGKKKRVLRVGSQEGNLFF